MATLRLDITQPLMDGMDVNFKTPCDCTAVDSLTVYYPVEEGTASRVFVFKDAHGVDITDLGNLFSSGVYVKVILDVSGGAAYIQNADNNSYLDSKFGGTSVTVNVPVSWTEASTSSTPSSAYCAYYQEVTVDGVTTDNNVGVGLASTATADQRQAAANAGLFAYSQGTNSVVICVAADGAVPEVVIPITVIIWG